MARGHSPGGLAALLTATPGAAQTPQVRFAAGTDCARNINCIPGFKRVYGIDPTSVFTPRTVADAGVQALDDGIAEVAVVFSSNPQLSRPDILALRDDKGMISEDHIVPVIRRSLLRRYGRPLRRRLDTASRLLSTLELRGLNQQVIDGRIPEAVGGEFADSNGLGGPSARKQGPRIRIGFQAFDENETLAHLYAEALRGAGYRVRVRPVGGLRPAAVSAMRHHRIDLWPGYSGSLLGYLKGKSLKRALKPIGATPLRLSPAQDRNGFAMKRDTAARLGISKLSDLKRYWPAAAASTSRARARAAADPRQNEQWAVAPDSVLDLPGAWALAAARASRWRSSTPARGWSTRTSPQHLDQLRRDPRQRRRRRSQRLRRRRPRRRSLLQAAQPGRPRRRRARHARRRDRRRGRERARRDRRRPAGQADDHQGPRRQGRRHHRRPRRGDPLRGRQRRADHQLLARAATRTTRA